MGETTVTELVAPVLQVYELAPEADSVIPDPEHEVPEPLMLMVGLGLTVKHLNAIVLFAQVFDPATEIHVPLSATNV